MRAERQSILGIVPHYQRSPLCTGVEGFWGWWTVIVDGGVWVRWERQGREGRQRKATQGRGWGPMNGDLLVTRQRGWERGGVVPEGWTCSGRSYWLWLVDVVFGSVWWHGPGVSKGPKIRLSRLHLFGEVRNGPGLETIAQVNPSSVRPPHPPTFLSRPFTHATALLSLTDDAARLIGRLFVDWAFEHKFRPHPQP